MENTGRRGRFSLELRRGLKATDAKRFAWWCPAILGVLLAASNAMASTDDEVSLNGAWGFLLCDQETSGPQDTFFQTGFDASQWPSIAVPATWELQGFEEPRYGEPSHSVGLYRREFTVPSAWRDGHVLLRFEGVLYGFECWVNGQRVGMHESAYTPIQFDIGAFVKYDAPNCLAVRVYKPFPYCLFDCSDDWALSGIFRDVVLRSVPSPYIAQLWTSTPHADRGRLTVKGTLDAFGEPLPDGLTLSGTLERPSGDVVARFDLPMEAGQSDFQYDVPVPDPQYWTAETPHTYELTVQIKRNATPLHRVTRIIGLRDVAIEDGVFTILGRPVKLRGVNRHEIHPQTGRAVREEDDQLDIQLMKAANITLVRTSHCPPHPRFLDMCDAQGLYVICEIPFDGGEALLQDPGTLSRLLSRADETVLPNRHHPSIILWSLGNENPYTPLVGAVAQHVKELDPTRPVCIPQVGSDFVKEGWTLPDFIDVLSPHYPTPPELESFAQKSNRPILATEYAHMLGKATEDLGACWETMLKYPRLAGGAIWHWCDQGLYRTAEAGAYEADLGKPLAGKIWVSKTQYMDCSEDKGADGIVYSDRQPQVDYWITRKVYAPVHIAEREFLTQPGPHEVTVTLTNRYDFTNLAALTSSWALFQNGTKTDEQPVAVDLAPGKTMAMKVSVNVPEGLSRNDCRLIFHFVDSRETCVYEHTVRLLPANERPSCAGWLQEDMPETNVEMRTDGGITHARFAEVDLDFDPVSGRFGLHTREGNIPLLNQSPYVRVGRLPTMAERRSRERRYFGKQSFWEPWLLSMTAPVEQRIDSTGASPVIRITGTCPRLDKEDQSVESQITLTLSPHGWLDVEYALTPRHATGIFLEAGLSLVLPKSITSVYWLGDGPFISYPGAEEASEHGLYALRTSDLWFDGNRKNVELALLVDDAGNGVAIACAPSQVAWERTPDGLILSHNALVGGRGTKNSRTRYECPVTAVETIKGQFRLVPLLAGKWPETIRRTFADIPPSSVGAGPSYEREYD